INGQRGSIVKQLRVWGAAAVLGLGLAACGDVGDEVKLPLEPGGGFKAEAVQGVKAELTIVDRVSPEAALIQARVSLRNTLADIATVTVPRPCDVQDWV